MSFLVYNIYMKFKFLGDGETGKEGAPQRSGDVLDRTYAVTPNDPNTLGKTALHGYIGDIVAQLRVTGTYSIGYLPADAELQAQVRRTDGGELSIVGGLCGDATDDFSKKEMEIDSDGTIKKMSFRFSTKGPRGFKEWRISGGGLIGHDLGPFQPFSENGLSLMWWPNKNLCKAAAKAVCVYLNERFAQAGLNDYMVVMRDDPLNVASFHLAKKPDRSVGTAGGPKQLS